MKRKKARKEIHSLKKRRNNKKSISLNMLLKLFIIFLGIFLFIYFYYKPEEIKDLTISKKDILRFPIKGESIREIKKVAEENKVDYVFVMMQIMIEKNFFFLDSISDITLDDIKRACREQNNFSSKRMEDYSYIKEVYDQALKDVKYFPIPKQKLYAKEENRTIEEYYDYELEYINSWEDQRNYNGASKHDGTDIMDQLNVRGRIPIVSMTDGKVERLGWNELGGYRIGIRAPSGAYFYYAHLHFYEKNIKEGMEIKSGDILGYMGDTGYSKEEGTVGEFPVHLHLGIALSKRDDNNQLVWINSYPVLKYIEDQRKILEDLK